MVSFCFSQSFGSCTDMLIDVYQLGQFKLHATITNTSSGEYYFIDVVCNAWLNSMYLQLLQF